MRPHALAVLSALALMAVPSIAAAEARYYVGAGPTGTSDFGFRGGWGGTLGVELPMAPVAAFLVRVDGGAVPSTGPTWLSSGHADESLALGESGPDGQDATAWSLMVGLRLESGGSLRPYLDALAGIGYLGDPANQNPGTYPLFGDHSHSGLANVALSLGPGLQVRLLNSLSVFADVHYDFYFSAAATTPLVPVRLGLVMQ